MRVPPRMLLLSVVLLSSVARAQVPFGVGDGVPLLDQLEISLLGRDVVAFGASGGEVRERLHVGEQVNWVDSRGLVGVVITDQRVLMVGTRSASWQERRYERGEAAPLGAQLGDRVALVTTPRRAIGFVAVSASLLEYRLGPQEVLRTAGVGEQVGVVLTTRNALGLSPYSDRFQAQDLQVHEEVEGVQANDSLVTVRTSERVLVFRANTASWSERRRDIHGR